mmetsp:Transcript_3755/g.9460  ORF Transcript_3755/g.9460 Transcript_3755/m.9460 type:complete len:89 (-) Transcript_3755:13-279(-)
MLIQWRPCAHVGKGARRAWDFARHLSNRAHVRHECFFKYQSAHSLLSAKFLQPLLVVPGSLSLQARTQPLLNQCPATSAILRNQPPSS